MGTVGKKKPSKKKKGGQNNKKKLSGVSPAHQNFFRWKKKKKAAPPQGGKTWGRQEKVVGGKFVKRKRVQKHLGKKRGWAKKAAKLVNQSSNWPKNQGATGVV